MPQGVDKGAVTWAHRSQRHLCTANGLKVASTRVIGA